MKNLSEVIDKLNEIKATYGDVKVGNDIDFTVTGFSYKYLLIFSELPLNRSALTKDTKE